jgi:hypothetical protein
VPHERVAEAIGLTRPVAWKLINGQRELKVREIVPLTKLLDTFRAERRALSDVRTMGEITMFKRLARDYPAQPDQPPIIPDEDENRYVRVPILPVYGGMGGGGLGDVLKDDTLEYALVPRALIEGILHGRPDDFLMIPVRGTSMEPLFRHGDDLLVDLRDKSPTQAGPFALWDSQHGEYLVKNVERLGNGLRVFSEKAGFSDREVEINEVTIIGRPVWFGRRL